MTTTLLLRVSSVIQLLFAVGHSLGGLQQWSPMGDTAVLRSMRDVHFDVLGVSRSYLDFFLGLGWTISVFMLMEAVLLWQLAELAKTDAVRVRPMIGVIALATVAGGVIAWSFILPIPALFSAVLAVTLGLAYAQAR
jgi:hypothetical protein